MPCDDGADNDGDGLTDQDDPECLEPSRVGLVSFNETPCEFAQQCVDLAEIGSGRGQVKPDTFFKTIASLEPVGWTAIGRAMLRAEGDLDLNSANVKALLLLTDGENNTPKDMVCAEGNPDNDYECPFAVAERLRERGVQVITVPLGQAADRLAMQSIAATTQGAMFDAFEEYQVVPLFLHAYAHERGEAMAVARHDIALDRPCPAPDEFCLLPLEYSVPVEVGAERLNVLVSLGAMKKEMLSAKVELVDPRGRVVQTTADVAAAGYSSLAQLNRPQPGTWKVRVSTRRAVNQHLQLAAHVANPLPGCFARVSEPVTDGRQPVTVTAGATYITALAGEGVQYWAWLRRPDGEKRLLPFVYDLDGNAQTTIDPGEFELRGSYEIVVTCKVADGARRREGESSMNGPPMPDDPVPAFQREVLTSVFVDNSSLPWSHRGSDSDHDGTPDSRERTTDTDGDGLPDWLDDDADGDDVPDHLDSDPTRRDPAYGSIY